MSSPSNTTTLRLPVEITHRQAQSVLENLKEQLKMVLAQEKQGGSIWVDVAQLKQFDSSAIGVLLELKRLAAQHKLNWKVLQAPQTLLTLADLYDMSELLELTTTKQQ